MFVRTWWTGSLQRRMKRNDDELSYLDADDECTVKLARETYDSMHTLTCAVLISNGHTNSYSSLCMPWSRSRPYTSETQRQRRLGRCQLDISHLGHRLLFSYPSRSLSLSMPAACTTKHCSKLLSHILSSNTRHQACLLSLSLVLSSLCSAHHSAFECTSYYSDVE